MKKLPITNDTIVALSTPQGVGAIGVIRLSGVNAIIICEKVFANLKLKPKTLQDKASHTIHFGVLHDEETIVDEVLISLFKGPNSYTSENTIEVSCHGSPYIQQQIIQLFIKHGARMATEGEFTLRAFLNGKLDLSQAEAVADLIASNSDASHQLAMQQMRGGFSNKIKELRQKLIDFASLIELELDFSEEDVEFADRTDLKDLVNTIQAVVQKLISSFDLGNVIKNGIPVAIVGKPNVGKSTLLNALLNEDKAIVSEIAGTTRDAIEDEMTINGVVFRFIDTAGIRVTDDIIEGIGVKKTFEKIKQASITIYMFDIQTTTPDDLKAIVEELTPQLNTSKLVLVGNKLDESEESKVRDNFSDFEDLILISAKAEQNLDNLKERLTYLFNQKMVSVTDTVVTNARHVEALGETETSLYKVLEGLSDNISGDFLAMDIRNALHHLGTITGDISTDDLLANIFSRFCIGK